MTLIMETDHDYALVEYIGAKNGNVHHQGVMIEAAHVPARVDHGRWLVQCPTCSSARLAHPDRGFWCAHCGNPTARGHDLVIDWPARILTIELILSFRPIENRWWFPGETIEELAAENAAHDLPAGIEIGA